MEETVYAPRKKENMGLIKHSIYPEASVHLLELISLYITEKMLIPCKRDTPQI